jgi:hypothetical protein
MQYDDILSFPEHLLTYPTVNSGTSLSETFQNPWSEYLGALIGRDIIENMPSTTRIA